MGRSFYQITLLCLVLSTSLFGDSGANHRERLNRPILLGVSGGNNKDITTEFCCSGTLGALVQDSSGRKYVLSNNHVIAKSNHGITGQPIGQPGLIDVNCRASRADPVARLSRFVKIRFDAPNRVDAAIGEVLSGTVHRFGKIMDIGKPGRPVEARLGMLVQKSGRTTGRTKGQIIAINTALRIDIPRKCGDEQGRSARFVDQIVIETTNDRPFLRSGDSGSLVVTRKRDCPRSVGLIFAGDDQGIAIANRIQNVLSELKVSMVGCATTTALSVQEKSQFDPVIQKAEEIRLRNEEKLFAIPGVVGSGIGSDDLHPDRTSIVVFLKKEFPKSRVPSFVEGMKTRVIPTSGFKAFNFDPQFSQP
jgi:hypothetical protein